MEKCYAIVLAAGQGTRMKSKLFKVMHPVMGIPMVEHVIQAVKKAGIDRVVAITGVGSEAVKEHLGDICEYAFQEEQLGTAHAVLQAEELLGSEKGTTVIIAGDTPLLTGDTLKSLLKYHQEKQAAATVLTAMADDPSGYGRVIRGDDELVAKIVEDKDTSTEEKMIREINTGTYCFNNELLFDALKQVDNHNAQGEYYLPDVLTILKDAGHEIVAYVLDDMDEALGVNDRIALSEATRIMRDRINRLHMQNGVTLIDPASTYIEPNVTIGSDTVIEPGVYLKGNTEIGSDVRIGHHAEITDSVVADGAQITQSVIESSEIGKGATVGPFARLRTGSVLKEEVHIGHFVEIKNSVIGRGTHAGHHAYIGDATVGEKVNIGCGVIFANYNGRDKSKTIVGDHVFIGSNATLVAPVTIAEHAFIAAGSTINRDVSKDAMAIARSRQVNKEGYANKLPYPNK